MSRALFSPLWYKVASLTPKTHPHLQVTRHTYHNQTWYVYHDALSGKNHRFSPASHKFISAFDGSITIDKLWESQNNELGDHAPSQEDVIKFIAQLFNAGILKGDITPDANDLFRHFKSKEHSSWKKHLWNPLAIRLPVYDPERFLTNKQTFFKRIFSWQMGLIWLLIILSAVLLVGEHWYDLKAHNIDNLLRPANLAILWLIYPIIKLLHELGHAAATKYYGGEVHEMGVLFLALIPIPYVDASNAAAFPQRGQRILVSAMGMMVELFLAALALFVWLQVENGLIKDICLNIMLIAGISTLLFNGNPLLKYDAYYILSDALDIPNLASRANKYIAYLFQVYGFGLQETENPANSNYEKVWFVLYAISSFLYRMFIVFVIALYISDQYFFIGVMLAIWYLFTQLAVPFVKGLYKIVKLQDSLARRNRIIVASTLFSSFIFLLLFVMPLPFSTVHEGVIWLHEDAHVRAAADGTIENIEVKHNAVVKFGQKLFVNSDPFISSKVKELKARLEQLQAQHQLERLSDRVQTAILEDAIKLSQADLKVARENEANLSVFSPANGNIIIPNYHDLKSMFVKKGELLAYVVGDKQATVRVIIPQTDISLLTSVKKIEVRMVNQLYNKIEARIERIIPTAKSNLPSAVLGRLGGGSIDIDPNDPQGLKTLETYFLVDISVPVNEKEIFLGTRAYVRFNYGMETLYQQLYRAIRQLFLSHFNV